MRKNNKFGFVQTVITSDGRFVGTTTIYARNKLELRNWETGGKDRVFIVNINENNVKGEES